MMVTKRSPEKQISVPDVNPAKRLKVEKDENNKTVIRNQTVQETIKSKKRNESILINPGL